MATTSQEMDPAQAALLAKVDPAELHEQPLVTNNRDFNWVTNKICGIVEAGTPTWWWVCMAVALITASFRVQQHRKASSRCSAATLSNALYSYVEKNRDATSLQSGMGRLYSISTPTGPSWVTATAANGPE